MRYIPVVINVIALVVGIIWISKIGFDFSASITTLGLVGTLVTWIITNGGLQSPPPNSRSSRNNPFMNKALVFIYVVVVLALLIVALANMNKTTIIGIDGDHNENNNIKIK